MRCAWAAPAGVWRVLAWLAALAWLVAPLPAASQPLLVPTVELSEKAGTLDAGALGLMWLDEGGSATIEQVTASPVASFAPMREDLIYTPGHGGALWLRYRLQRDAGQQQDWLIEFPIPVLDSVTVYQQEPGGQWKGQAAGDTLPMSLWPQAGRYAFFHLKLAAGQTRDIYVRLRHATPLSIPVRLSTEPAHKQRLQVEYLGLGAVFGAMLLLIVACVALSWVYRDGTYAWYSIYAAIMTLAVAAYTGVAGHLVWGDFSYWTDEAQGVLALLAAGSAMLFIRHLTGISARFARLDQAVRWGGWAALPLVAIFLAVSKPVALLLVGTYLAVVAVTNMLVAWLAWRRGDVVGLWVLAAYVPLTAAVLLTVLRLFGWLPVSFGTQYAVVLASALEVPLLLVALAIRSRERHGAEVRAMTTASHDALTGLLGVHLFNDRLQQLVTRYQRHGEEAAVVFVDLLNYSRIKSLYGSAVAEQSLLRSVIKLRRLARDVDTVGRIGEARFGLIMEGINSRSTVTYRAAQLIASGLMPLKGLKPEVTLQFHIAAVLLGERCLEAPQLTAALDQLLHTMSARTRRPIRFLEPEVTAPAQLDADSVRDADPENDDEDTAPVAMPAGGHPAQSNA